MSMHKFLRDYIICLGGSCTIMAGGHSIGHFICAHARDSRPTNGRGWSCDFVQRLPLQAVSVVVLARSCCWACMQLAPPLLWMTTSMHLIPPTSTGTWAIRGGDDYTTWLSREQHSYTECMINITWVYEISAFHRIS